MAEEFRTTLILTAHGRQEIEPIDLTMTMGVVEMLEEGHSLFDVVSKVETHHPNNQYLLAQVDRVSTWIRLNENALRINLSSS